MRIETIIEFLFSADRALFTILGYPLSFLELSGVITGLATVYLAAREKTSNWPIGIVNIGLFALLFYQLRLYSDMFLQIFFLVTSVYGWWRWTHPGPQANKGAPDELRISRSGILELALYFLAVVLISLGWGSLVARLHIFLPSLFPEAAALPYPNSAIMALSVCATFLMARKRLECWWFWIVNDILAIFVYAFAGAYLLALEYLVFGALAASGLISWSKNYRLRESPAATDAKSEAL